MYCESISRSIPRFNSADSRAERPLSFRRESTSTSGRRWRREAPRRWPTGLSATPPEAAGKNRTESGKKCSGDSEPSVLETENLKPARKKNLHWNVDHLLDLPGRRTDRRLRHTDAGVTWRERLGSTPSSAIPKHHRHRERARRQRRARQHPPPGPRDWRRVVDPCSPERLSVEFDI